jgi:hypothetical protein
MVDRQQEVVVGGLVSALLGRLRRTVTARHHFLCDLRIHLSNHRVIRHETRPSVVNWAAISARAETPILHHDRATLGINKYGRPAGLLSVAPEILKPQTRASVGTGGAVGLGGVGVYRLGDDIAEAL